MDIICAALKHGRRCFAGAITKSIKFNITKYLFSNLIYEYMLKFLGKIMRIGIAGSFLAFPGKGLAGSKDHFFNNSYLQKFFGDTRGSYIDPDQPLARQMEDALGVDLAAMGRPIERMIPVGEDEYLDPGFVVHAAYLGGAVIVKPSGQIVAAAMDWYRCYSPFDCNENTRKLTIFVKRGAKVARARAIFEHWAKLFDERLEAESLPVNQDVTMNWQRPIQSFRGIVEIKYVK